MDLSRKLIASTCFAIAGAVASLSMAHALELPNQTQLAVRSATFEVVVPKPEGDVLTYEKPLPMDLLPYSIRNDKFEPMGTAFAFSKDQYVTAAHVLHLGSKSQRSTPVLRDAEGHIYHIDQIVKYSLSRDFVVFTLKEHPKNNPLKENTKLAVGEPIFAVGNALGQGVIIRDGLYTSDTPEEQDGRWKWLRFSAAASPGNSGGPLLDKKGNVVGVVLRKSANENLNYALPIAEIVNAKNNVASVDSRGASKLEIMDTTERDTLTHEYPLPKPIDELDKALIVLIDEFNDSLSQKLLDKNKDSIFPAGINSHALLHSSGMQPFPSLIKKRSDGIWVAEPQTKVSRADLGHNGVLQFNIQEGVIVLHIRKPDDLPHEQFYNDSKVFMDTVLKALPMTRNIGSEKIRITSIGKATDDLSYVDTYGRKWQLRVWPVEYSDSAMVVMALPIPNGYAAFLMQVPTALIHRRVASFKTLSNFIYLSYQGSLDLWREYLQDKKLQPDVFSQIRIEYDYGDKFKYESNLLSLQYGNALQTINSDSGLALRFSYFNLGDKVVWNVAGLGMNANIHGKEGLNITRHIEPTEDMQESVKQGWQRIINGTHPFDGIASPSNDATIVQTQLLPAADSKAVAGEKVLYTAGQELEGSKDQATMKSRLDKFTKSVKVLEK